MNWLKGALFCLVFSLPSELHKGKPQMFKNIVLVSCLALLLAACAAPVHMAEETLKATQKPGYGTLVASVTINTNEVSQFHSLYLELIQAENPKLKPNANYYLVNTLPGLSRDTSLFIGDIPAGIYRLSKMTGGGKYLSLGGSGKAGGLTGFVKVQQGKIADLGRIVASAVNSHVFVGRSKLITENKALVEKHAKDYASLTQTEWVNGWQNKERRKSDFVESFAIRHPIGMGGVRELDGGVLVAGSRMGTVFQRQDAGWWKLIGHTGTLEAILSMTSYNEGDYRLVVAGERGAIYKLGLKGLVTPVERGNLPVGDIIFIDHNKSFSSWFVGVRDNDSKQLTLFTSTQLENAQWEPLKSETFAFDFWAGGRNVWVWKRGEGLGFASTEGDKIHCLNYDTLEWQTGGVPEKRRLIGLQPGYNGSIGALTGTHSGFAGAFAKTHLSSDCGQSWQETHSPYRVKASAPLKVSEDLILESGGVFGDQGIYASSNQGKEGSWTKISDAEVLSEAMLYTEKNGIIMISKSPWGWETVQQSDDNGKSWEYEYSSYSSKMAELLK